MAAAGQPSTPVIPVRGGSFGGETEATVVQLLTSAFGEGCCEAIAEITAKRGKEIVAKRAAEEEKRVAEEEEKAAKEAKEAEKVAEKHAKHEAAAHATHKH